MQKKGKTGIRNLGIRIWPEYLGYLPSSPYFLSDPNPKVHYPGTILSVPVPNIKKYPNSYPKKSIFTICIWYPTSVPDPFTPLFGSTPSVLIYNSFDFLSQVWQTHLIQKKIRKNKKKSLWFCLLSHMQICIWLIFFLFFMNFLNKASDQRVEKTKELYFKIEGVFDSLRR